MRFASISDASRSLSRHWTWPNFAIDELACHCAGRFCDGEYWHDPNFLDRLQALREGVGRPLVITSGHRCRLWNAFIRGAPRSQHKTMAVDISLRGRDRHQLFARAQRLGFTGFGLAQSFLHLDLRDGPAIWYYPGSKTYWQM